jgi:DNA-binding NarL/FixJ family response regulator
LGSKASGNRPSVASGDNRSVSGPHPGSSAGGSGGAVGRLGAVEVPGARPRRERCSLVLASTGRRLLVDALGWALQLDDAFDFKHAEHVVHGPDMPAMICESVRPDVLLLDVDGGSPTSTIAVLRRVKAASPDTRILLLVPSRKESGLFVEYIEAGADGFIDYSAALEEVATRVWAAGAGATAASDRELVDVLRKAAGERDATTRTATGFRSLTDRELEILRLIGDGLGNDDIAASLHISAHTVASHIQNLYRKMDVHSRAAAIAATNKIGLTINEAT